jgi:hypothetical protein
MYNEDNSIVNTSSICARMQPSEEAVYLTVKNNKVAIFDPKKVYQE